MQKLSEFDYNLPPDLIATSPSKKRDHSRLLVLDKKTGDINDRKFLDILDYLLEGDVLVLNNSKVFPSRLIGVKEATGGKVEIFLHKKIDDKKKEECLWECLVGGKKIKQSLLVDFENKLKAEIIKNNNDGTWLVSFDKGYSEMMRVVDTIGRVPLPPYIKTEKRKEAVDDKITYQTVYADDAKLGSVAAPTAGLHFTPELLEKIKEKGVSIEYITLHVGMGTFASVKTENIEEHKMHAEYVEVSTDTMRVIREAKKNKQRVITVGTTSTRTLEAVFANTDENYQAGISRDGFAGFINIFIYPGYKFKVVDAMITNFHLPKSSLIMLVSALAGKENIDKTYKHALESKYRFYSYGDAMFIY